jgi:hypothetical protein
MLHRLAIACLVLAGCAYFLGAWRRWRALGSEGAPTPAWPAWAGFALLTAALVADHLAGPQRGFAHAVLGAWAAAAAVHQAAGGAAGQGAARLLRPAGALPRLAARTGRFPRPPADPAEVSTRLVSHLHMVTMALYLGAALLAGAVGGLWLLAASQLKHPSPRALALPPLPRLERLCERALVATTALLTAGLACGGAALEGAHGVALLHPSVFVAGLNLVLLASALALRAGGRLSRRGLAWAALHSCLLAVLCAVGLAVIPHG